MQRCKPNLFTQHCMHITANVVNSRLGHKCTAHIRRQPQIESFMPQGTTGMHFKPNSLCILKALHAPNPTAASSKNRTVCIPSNEPGRVTLEPIEVQNKVVRGMPANAKQLLETNHNCMHPYASQTCGLCRHVMTHASTAQTGDCTCTYMYIHSSACTCAFAVCGCAPWCMPSDDTATANGGPTTCTATSKPAACPSSKHQQHT
jgi:hypothetical protein